MSIQLAPGMEPVPNYRLVKFLGKGGFGQVWEAVAPGGTRVALKFIHLTGKQGRKEFYAIRVIKNIRHANLVPVIALWLLDQQGALLEDSLIEQADPKSSQMLPHFDSPEKITATPAELVIAMGLGDKSLYDRLKECRDEGQQGIPPEELVEYMHAAAHGIDFLNRPTHDLGNGPISIQHCDIKPQNIMLLGDSAQICDFGLARVLSQNEDKRHSIGLGSPAYAAPETLTREGPGAYTDQYSLAISYYELRCGQLPFPDDATVIEAMQFHLEGRLDYSLLPAAEQSVIRRATSRDPEQRFPTAIKMVRALDRAISGAMGTTEEVEDPPSGSFQQKILSPDTNMGKGYQLTKRVRRIQRDEIWEAQDAKKRHATVVFRDLNFGKIKPDLEPLKLLEILEEHPHLLPLKDYWLLDSNLDPVTNGLDKQLQDGADKLVLVSGQSGKTILQRLEEVRETGSGIPFKELLGYMQQLAEALDFLNAREHDFGGRKVSILHQNVLPLNITLSSANMVRLGNFSYAFLLDDDTVSITDSNCLPHVSFTPPEAIEGYLSRWGDQYALAILFLHLQRGMLPFDATGSTKELLKQVREGNIDLAHLPPGVAEVIQRATQADPYQRFATCKEFVKALKETQSRATPSRSAAPASTAGPSTPRTTLEPNWEGPATSGKSGVDNSGDEKRSSPPSYRQTVMPEDSFPSGMSKVGSFSGGSASIPPLGGEQPLAPEAGGADSTSRNTPGDPPSSPRRSPGSDQAPSKPQPTQQSTPPKQPATSDSKRQSPGKVAPKAPSQTQQPPKPSSPPSGRTALDDDFGSAMDSSLRMRPAFSGEEPIRRSPPNQSARTSRAPQEPSPQPQSLRGTLLEGPTMSQPGNWQSQTPGNEPSTFGMSSSNRDTYVESPSMKDTPREPKVRKTFFADQSEKGQTPQSNEVLITIAGTLGVLLVIGIVLLVVISVVSS